MSLSEDPLGRRSAPGAAFVKIELCVWTACSVSRKSFALVSGEKASSFQTMLSWALIQNRKRLFGEIALSLGFIEDNALRRYADYLDEHAEGAV